MAKGINNYGRKEKRKMRIRNHIAHDLASPKYRQRVKQDKKRKDKDNDNQNWKQDVNDYLNSKK